MLSSRIRTEQTLEWLLSSVYTHVLLQVVLLFEGHVASFPLTGIRPLQGEHHIGLLQEEAENCSQKLKKMSDSLDWLYLNQH